jgi:putative transposase
LEKSGNILQYPKTIRQIIYTTNAIESLNSQLRKVTKNKRVFPSDESVFKTLYLTINYITAKWTMPIRNWNEAMAHFLIKFDDRIQRVIFKGLCMNLHNWMDSP